MLAAAEEAKLDVNVINKVYVSRTYQTPWGGLAFGGGLDPQNTGTFFKNYENLVIPLGKLLEEYHVKSWLVFDEMDKLEKYGSFLHKLLNAIENVYSGRLGIDEATNNMVTGDSYLTGEPPHQKSFEEIAGRCWDWADRQGKYMIRAYSCYAIAMETRRDQRASIMPEGFVEFWRPVLDFYHHLFPNNPDMFGEQGEYDTDGVCLGSLEYWHTPEKKVLDNQEVADAWYGYLKGDQELGIDRINIWSLTLGDFWYGYEAGDFLICLDSPMYRVITSIIKPEE